MATKIPLRSFSAKFYQVTFLHSPKVVKMLQCDVGEDFVTTNCLSLQNKIRTPLQQISAIVFASSQTEELTTLSAF